MQNMYAHMYLFEASAMHHMQIADLVTDSYVLSYVLRDGRPGISKLVAPWISCFAVACIASLVLLVYELKLLIGLFRQQQHEFDIEDPARRFCRIYPVEPRTARDSYPTESKQKLSKHQRLLIATEDRIKIIYLTLLVAIVENLPMGTGNAWRTQCTHAWHGTRVPMHRRTQRMRHTQRKGACGAHNRYVQVFCR